MTIIEKLRNDITDPVIQTVADNEKKDVSFIVDGLLSGEIVIPKNVNRSLPRPCGIGKGLTTKVNANIGTSPAHSTLEVELEKLRVAEAAGADAVMDLSTGGDIMGIRKIILSQATVPIGTVPIYQVAQKYVDEKRPIKDIPEEELFDALESHAASGVDFMTIHCGVTRQVLEKMHKQTRMMDIVSRGGAILACWITENNKENPLYTQYDRLLDIMEKYDVCLSLGDGMRPGCLADATDDAQIGELEVLGELAQKAHERGVQVMIEGPGHIPLHEIEKNMRIQKELCNNAPFYVLGPIVTDVAPGYDHLTSAIGGALAAMHGADFLCYVTPSEHLGLPGPEAVKEGVIASRIAAHAGDIAKGVSGARDWDDEMALHRKKRDWKKQFDIALDPVKAKSIRDIDDLKEEDICSMCGDYCSLKIMEGIGKTKE